MLKKINSKRIVNEDDENENGIRKRFYDKTFLLKNQVYKNKKTHRFYLPKINVNDSAMSNVNRNQINVTNETKTKSKINKNKINCNKTEKDEKDDMSDTLSNPPKSRVDRFLSLYVDETSILLENLKSSQNFATQKKNENLTKEKAKRVNSFDFKAEKKSEVLNAKLFIENKRKPSYHSGEGLPQNLKANIIRSILADYNVEYYVNKFTSCDAALIKLDPLYVFHQKFF